MTDQERIREFQRKSIARWKAIREELRRKVAIHKDVSAEWMWDGMSAHERKDTIEFLADACMAERLCDWKPS